MQNKTKKGGGARTDRVGLRLSDVHAPTNKNYQRKSGKTIEQNNF